MSEKVYVDEVANLQPRIGLKVVYNDTPIAVFKLSDDTIRAIGNTCPHAGGPLVDGIVTDHEVICPLHSWHIDLDTGEAIDEPGECVKTYPVLVEDGKVYLEI